MIKNIDSDIQILVKKALDIITGARLQSDKVIAWNALQDRDEEGNSRGCLPYTEKAIKDFTNAYQNSADDPDVIHHLAIAHHALAWDLENQNDSRAKQEWEAAFYYWRLLVGLKDFWIDKKNKLYEIDKNADPSFIDEFRNSLLERLLDIHVSFVRRYSELECHERAINHIEIVQNACIAPAVKKSLIQKVFDAMTGSVISAKVAGEYLSAIVSLNRFLVLFPEYLPALRMCIEIYYEWISKMSCQDEWNDIVNTVNEADPHITNMLRNPDLKRDSLAEKELLDIGYIIISHSEDKGLLYLARNKDQITYFTDRHAAMKALELGIKWGRLFLSSGISDSRIKFILSSCLVYYAFAYHEEVKDIMNSDAEPRDQLRACIKVDVVTIALFEEALAILPEEPEGDEARSQILEQLNNLRKELDKLNTQKNIIDLFGGLL
ncbi:MAG: hypothetical protein WBM02_10400 [bacterium]